MVINAKDLDTRWKKLASSSGVKVISKLEIINYPRANGGTISVKQTMIMDPDGYWLEVNQILDKPASAKD